jgi:hypothetical protein
MTNDNHKEIILGGNAVNPYSQVFVFSSHQGAAPVCKIYWAV